MEVASLTSKHQITIPSKVRRLLNLHKGDRLAFLVAEDGTCSVRKMTLQKSDGAAKAFLKAGSPPLSEELVRNAVRKGALESYHRRNR